MIDYGPQIWLLTDVNRGGNYVGQVTSAALTVSGDAREVYAQSHTASF